MEGLGNLVLMAIIYGIWKFIKNIASETSQKGENQEPPIVYRQNKNILEHEKIKKQPIKRTIIRQEDVGIFKKEESNKTYSDEEKSIKEIIDNEASEENTSFESIFEITDETIINGIIMREVLGPPKASNF